MLLSSNSLVLHLLPVVPDEAERDRLADHVVRHGQKHPEHVLLADAVHVRHRVLQEAGQNPGFPRATQRGQDSFLLARDCRLLEALPRKVPFELVAVLDRGAVHDVLEVRRNAGRIVGVRFWRNL